VDKQGLKRKPGRGDSGVPFFHPVGAKDKNDKASAESDTLGEPLALLFGGVTLLFGLFADGSTFLLLMHDQSGPRLLLVPLEASEDGVVEFVIGLRC
jgi:hypothetical protein